MATAKELAGKLLGLRLTEDELKLVMHSGGLEIEAEAKRRAPVLTGSLRRDIGTETFTEAGGRVGVAKIGNTKAIPYARVREFVGRKKGYLRGSLSAKAEDAARKIGLAIQAVIRAR